MRTLALALCVLLCGATFAQMFPFPGFVPAAGGTPIAFVQASAFDASGSSATLTTGAATTTTGNLLYVMTRSDAGGVCTGPAAGNILNVTDLAGDTFINIAPAAAGCIVRLIWTGGSGYGSSPTFTITGGCSGAGTYFPVASGGVITTISTTVPATGCSGSITGAFSGGSPSVPAALTGVILGVTDGAHAVCTEWYAKNITGTSNNTVTFTQPATTFSGLTVQEFSGLSASAPLDTNIEVTSSSSVSSVTTGAFSTATPKEVAVMGGTIENTASTWAAGSGYILPAAATASSQKTITSQYQIFSSTQSGVTAVSPTSNKTGSMCGMLAAFHQ